MAGETNVGGIVGFLRLEADQFHREIERALAELEILDGKRVNVDINVDKTGAASIANADREVKKLDESVKKVDGSVKRLDTSTRSSGRGIGALGTAIITLGPALVPLAAGATALAAAFGGLGTAGVLAIVGIKREMDQGTTTGLQFGSAIDSAKSDMQDLASVAAKNVLRPFQDAVGDLNSRMPALRGQIGDLATITGKAAGALAGGLLSAFQQLEPLMRDASVYILNLSRRFQEAMSGGGIVAFGDYVRSVFPQVMRDVEAIVEAAGRLVAAFAPLGLGTLGLLRTLADLINAIPVDALAVIAQMAGSVFLGFKAWQGLNVLIGGVSTALQVMGASAERAAGAVRGLQAAAGVIGVAIAALSFVFANNAESQRQAQQATDDYTEALRRSNGVIDESVRKVAFDTLQKQGAIDAAKQLGISLGDVTLAATGNQAAYDRVNAVIKDAIQNHRDLWGAAHDLHSALGENNTELKNAQQANKDQAEALGQTAAKTDSATIATQNLARVYGTSVTAVQAYWQSQVDAAAKTDAATFAMQQQNDAAGLLKQSLDALNGEALTAADAQNAFESSLANMGDHVTKTGKQVKFTTTSINDMSAASVALRGQLNGQIRNLQNVVEANGGLSDSTGKAREQMVKMRQQIIDNAVAHGVDREAVTKYIDKLLKIPKTVPPTKLDVATAEALKKKKQLQDSINALKGKTVTIRINEVFAYTALGSQSASAAERRFADSVTGAGSSSAADRQAGGGIHMGGVRKMAVGDISHPSMIMRSTKPILWNEAPGGEAFISLAPQQRARSLAIHDEVGRLIGARSSAPAPAGPSDLSDRTIRKLARAMGEIHPEARVNKLSSALAGDD